MPRTKKKVKSIVKTKVISARVTETVHELLHRQAEDAGMTLSQFAAQMLMKGRVNISYMANAGMDIKALQYVMGHSDASITLNVYTHASYDHAAEQMAKLVDFPGSSDRQERKMSG